MAKVKVTTLVDIPILPYTQVTGFSPVPLATYSETRAVFEEVGGGEDQIIFKGRNFEVTDGKLTSGMITKAVVVNSEGQAYAILTELNVRVKHIEYNDGGELLASPFYSLLLKGNDTLTGSSDGDWIVGYESADRLLGMGGDDSLLGNAGAYRLLGMNGDDRLFGDQGRDTHTGGKGSDGFFVGPNQGRDIITDFDPRGSDQDHLWVNYLEYEKRKSGNDTIIEFNDGAQVRLIDIKPSEITDTDFQLFP